MKEHNLSALQSNQSNVNQPHSQYPAQFLAVSLTLSTLIISSNVVIIMLYCFKKNLRSKKNFLLVSLAVSDLFSGLIVLPLYLSCVEDKHVTVCYASAISFRFLTISTILHILAVTLEKYFTILHPFSYKGLVRRRHLRMICASIWIISLCVSSSSLSWHLTNDWETGLAKDYIYFLVTGTLFFLLPLLILIVAHIQMFRAICESINMAKNLRYRQRRKSSSTPDLARYCVKSNRKALLAFALMLGMFALCWTTYYVGAMMICLGRSLASLGLHINFYNTLHTLVFLPSLVNPMLYTYYKQDFRQALFSKLKPRPCTIIARLQGASTLTVTTPSSR